MEAHPSGGAASRLDGTDQGTPRVFAVGEVLDLQVRTSSDRSHPPDSGTRLPIDVARTLEELLSTVPLDFVHVHEPFAPSTSNAALRHSRSLNVGSFHSPTERLLSTLVARRFVETFLGRLDARIASFSATAELMARHFPGDYRLRAPTTRTPPRSSRTSTTALRRAGTAWMATRRCTGDWRAES